jgi:hypothetical protein
MRNRIASLVLVGTLGVPLLGGCSGQLMGEEAATDLAQSICDLAFRCCTPNEVDFYLSPFVTPEDCAERLVASASLSTTATFSVPIGGATVTFPNVYALDRAIKDDRVRIRRSALRACLAQIDELTCNMEPVDEPVDPIEGCDPTLPEPPGDPNPCAISTLVEGQVGEGGRCTTGTGGLECKEGLTCLRLTTWLGVDGACGAPQRLGETCFADNECDGDLHCSLIDGTCQERRRVNETCMYAEGQEGMPAPSTLLLKCEFGLTCSPFDEVCVGPCQHGYACTNDAQCEEGLVCARFPNSQGGTNRYCAAPQPEGGLCMEDGECQAGLRCEGAFPFSGIPGTCTPLLANGAFCSGMDSNCQSGICSSYTGSCISSLANGGNCFRHVECQSDFCHPSMSQCEATVAIGGACPTGNNQQCANGRCQLPGSYFPPSCAVETQAADCPSGACNEGTGLCLQCTTNTHCATGRCNTETNLCENACVALLANGASCTSSTECASGTCLIGGNYCASPPLPDGEQCWQNNHCESGVCNFGAIPSVCITPPLDNGQPCALHTHCASRVCHDGSCRTGAGEGADCGGGQLPCDPYRLFCDLEAANPRCTLLSETGETCSRNLQCRSGNCTVRWGRTMCSAAAPLDGFICEG